MQYVVPKYIETIFVFSLNIFQLHILYEWMYEQKLCWTENNYIWLISDIMIISDTLEHEHISIFVFDVPMSIFVFDY